MSFTGLEGFPEKQKKTNYLKVENGITKRFRIAALLAEPWVRGIAV